jgi:hypothetical protein
MRPRFAGRLPSKNKRAQETPGARCTRSPACKGRKHTGVVTTGSPGHPAFPARWFYGFLRALLGDRACLPPSPHGETPRDLTPASGRQDHTTSPSASAPFVKGTSTSTAPRSNVRDDGRRPSSGTGWRQYADDLPRKESEKFLAKGLDSDLGVSPLYFSSRDTTSRDSSVRNRAREDAPPGAGSESITPVVLFLPNSDTGTMDSGFVLRMPRNDEL